MAVEGSTDVSYVLTRLPWRTRLAQSVAGLRTDWMFAAVDAIAVALAYSAALVIRLIDVDLLSQNWWSGFFVMLPVIITLHLVTNLASGAYGHVWEYASVEEAMRLVVAAAAAGVALLGVVMGIEALSADSNRLMPIGVIVLGDALALGLMGALRFRSRMFSFNRNKDLPQFASTIVVGTGRAAAELARMSHRGHQPMQVLGFVASNGYQTEKRLAGLPVLGTLSDLPQIIEAHDIEQIVIEERLDNDTIRELVDKSLEVDVRLRIVPQLEDILGSDGRLTDIRDLALTDLLPRAAVATDLAGVEELIKGRRVLVTGAGGSIGSEITKQVTGMQPAAVVGLDNDESHLYEAALDWADGPMTVDAVLCDIRDAARIQRVFEEFRPQVVFHAAAHKHVPILEAYPGEAVKTNIAGTRNLLEAVAKYGTERFVLISTDKAVDPSSVMGASKRIAEMMVQSAATTMADKCVYTAVRFGNVLGSRGSVVPTFMHQIQAGGPVTVSDPNMLRYFMTVDEAVHLVLQAGSLASGGEVFVLDMGEPVRIGDLARRMIRLAGLVPGRDIQVEVTGARPGEKLVEVLSKEPLRQSAHPKIGIASPAFPPAVTLYDAVSSASSLASQGRESELLELLHAVAWQTWSPDEIVDLVDLEQSDIVESV